MKKKQKEDEFELRVMKEFIKTFKKRKMKIKPNKSYKAIMLEIDVTKTLKKSKPKDMTMSEYITNLIVTEQAYLKLF